MEKYKKYFPLASTSSTESNSEYPEYAAKSYEDTLKNERTKAD
jgi:hypothetical protein